MHQFSRKERYMVANTLCAIPYLLQGHSVLIDLLNEVSIAGRIESADGLMNIHLREVVYIDRNGQQYPFEQFMVRARMIRQIHIPGYMDMEKELKNWISFGMHPRSVAKKGKTFKQKRALERHKEIVQQISEHKKTSKTED